MQKYNYININNFKLKFHPASLGLKKISYLVKSISELKKKNSRLKKNIVYKDYTIFIGMTGAIVEALERNIKLIHIVQDIEIDMYSKDIWPNIKAQKLFDDIYTYKLKKKGQMIKFGTNNTKYF